MHCVIINITICVLEKGKSETRSLNFWLIWTERGLAQSMDRGAEWTATEQRTFQINNVGEGWSGSLDDTSGVCSYLPVWLLSVSLLLPGGERSLWVRRPRQHPQRPQPIPDEASAEGQQHHVCEQYGALQSVGGLTMLCSFLTFLLFQSGVSRFVRERDRSDQVRQLQWELRAAAAQPQP